MTLPQARERICFDTHHFARRQLGWFRRLPKLTFLDIGDDETAERIAGRVLTAWE
jgi:tRNA A37 N6-isopentenylltransferase MiaA